MYFRIYHLKTANHKTLTTSLSGEDNQVDSLSVNSIALRNMAIDGNGVILNDPRHEEEGEDDVQDDDVEAEATDEDEDEEDGELMKLGFVEKPEASWSLLRQYFPSKAGGTPAWLDPVNLPSGRSILCDFCGEPLQFVLQLYAALDEESTFHRMLFLFMCPSMGCLLRDQHEQWKRHPDIPSRSVKVFRCQLPRVNSFYSCEVPAEDGTEKPLILGAPLCNWCGTWKGDKICSSCRKVRYCSGKHQAAHWRSSISGHKISCRQLQISGKECESGAASRTLWPEYEITHKDEDEFEEKISGDDSSNISLISRSQADESYGQWMKYFERKGDSKSWASFQEKISLAPDQILRYSRSSEAKPLWPVAGGRPSVHDIPKCSFCGANRIFEFQVLPQLIFFSHVEDGENSLDWATIAVYTCEASCDGDVAYKEEFAWVQLA